MKNYIIRHNNDFFENAFDGLFRPLYQPTKDLMRTDVRDTEGAYLFDIEMPGFAKEDISVSFDNGYLTVNASRKVEEEKKDAFIRQERNCSCEREFYVGDIDEKLIKAKYENGVLYLTVPKDAPKKEDAHVITID